MKKIKKNIPLFAIFIFLLLLPEWANAHIKWFVQFDISDPPQEIMAIKQKYYYFNLLVLSVWGVVIASLLDSYWCKKWGDFTLISHHFSNHNDIALSIARIGTGIFFIVIWLVGDTILTPELISQNSYIPYVQLIIAASLLFKRGMLVAGVGILFLYANAVYYYGVFHMMDYVNLIGLAIFLIISALDYSKFNRYRLPVLYLTLIFSFLWSAIEKIAYPQWFYPFLEKYEFLTLGLDINFFIASAAFVEFTLFFLLLITRNGVVLLAFLINLLITSGNIYFGKVDAIGHFPVNFTLLIMLLKGPLPVQSYFFDHSCKSYTGAFKSVLIYIISLFVLFSLYYGLHQFLY